MKEKNLSIQMRKYLIHTDTISGHQLEYIHHLYMDAVLHPDDSFIFVLPQKFKHDSACFEWPTSNNIKILILKEGEETTQNCNLLKKGWINSRVIGKYAKNYKVTDVIAISIMAYLPFLPLFLNGNVHFSGIVYRIYLYEWKEESLSMKIQDVIKYWIMSRFRVFYRIYMCNDSASAQCLNRIFRTNKYRYIPDPVASLADYTGQSIREELNIIASKKILLHIGSMDSYKNTLAIMRSLLMLDIEKSDKIAVILAGRVIPSIRKEFDFLYKQVEHKIQIIFLEGYLSFERLADLFVTCDYVLVPYNVKSQSSGIVGHSAFYGKPVIAVQGGIIGKMVRKWHLGHLLYQSSDISICQFISDIVEKPSCTTKGNTYLDSHSVEMFCKTIFSEEK